MNLKKNYILFLKTVRRVRLFRVNKNQYTMWMSKDVSKTPGIEKTTCLHNDIVIMLLLERIPLFGRARKSQRLQ